MRSTAIGNDALLRQRLILHASVLQHVGPRATRTGVAVFQVLAEVIGAEELLRLVAFAEFVNMVEMFGACLPAWRVGEFFTTVTADVRTIAGHRRMESGFRTGKRGA